MKIPERILWMSVLPLLCGMLALDGRAQNISMTSPFLPRNGSGINTTTENSPVELRGILKSEGIPVFGLYDPVKKQGGWVKLNEAGKDFPATVRNYDAPNEAVTVDYQGRVLNLALKAAKIESMPAMAQIAPMPRPMPGQPGPAIAPAPSVDNARQMEAVAAEVARRRQQRQAALQQNPPVPQPGQSQPQPQGQPQPPMRGPRQ